MASNKKEFISIYKEVIQEIKTRLSLKDVVDELCPMPSEAVVLGMGNDGKPILLNVKNKDTYNIVIWDKMAKQGLKILKVIAEYTFLYHKKCSIFGNKNFQVEFAVLTKYPEDWGQLNDYGMGIRGKTSCIGIIPFYSELADQVIHGLAAWINEPHNNAKNPVIVLIDGLENLMMMDTDFKLYLRYILHKGRNKNVYVIGTASKKNFAKVQDWLDGFQFEIRGKEFDTFEMDEGKNIVVFYAPTTEMI